MLHNTLFQDQELKKFWGGAQPATVLAAALTSAPSLGRQLEAAPAIVTSAVAAAVACAGSQPSRPCSPWSPVRQTPKSMASHVVELAEMEGGQSAIGLLIIDSSCTLGLD